MTEVDDMLKRVQKASEQLPHRVEFELRSGPIQLRAVPR